MKFIYFTAALIASGTFGTTVKAESVQLNCPGPGDIECAYVKEFKAYDCKVSSGKAKWSMSRIGGRMAIITKEIEPSLFVGLAGKSNDSRKNFMVTGCLYRYVNKDGTKHGQPELLGMYPEGYNEDNGWNCHAETLDLNVIECDPIEKK